MRIVTDIKQLDIPSQPVKSVEEGGKISRILQATLRKHNKSVTRQWQKQLRKQPLIHGLGLSAIQIGIAKQVCLILVNDVPIVLMNPVVVEKSETTIPFTEGCLSLPGVEVEVQRHLWFVVDTLNRGRIEFGPRNIEPDGQIDISRLMLRSVVAQHEMDHLNGRTILFYQTEKHEAEIS